MQSPAQAAHWQLSEVRSPHIPHPVPVVVARDVPYFPNNNHFQTLNIYLPQTESTSSLIGKPVTFLPPSTAPAGSTLPRWHVHIHGGAWRDPQLTATSIEAAAAHALSAHSDGSDDRPIDGIASLNYTLSRFPTHPTLPYDPIENQHSDPAREAVHPEHVRDVLSGFALLRSLGLTDGAYLLTAHSAGACLACQATLQTPEYWGLAQLPAAPRPAALLGLNGLYDLPELVTGLGESHAHLVRVYESLLGNAFGADRSAWVPASPARFEAEDVAQLVADGRAPRLVLLDQSAEDQLVPMNQVERMEARLSEVRGLRVVRGHRCIGSHAVPWEEGVVIWESVLDALELLKEEK